MGSPYLIVYNTACLVGWAYCLYLTIASMAAADTPAQLWQKLERPLQVTQTAAVLEIAHSALGLVRSPVMTTLQQVFSRVFIVWGILWAVPHATAEQTLPLFSAGGFDFELSIFTLMLAWGVTEVIRYAFYASKELGGTPFAILWLRYTTFIFLYPLGVSSELGLVWMVLPALKRSGLWCYPMPNALNFAFDYYWFCILVAVGYIPGFPKLYMYMFTQRKKALGPEPATRAAKKLS